MTRRPVAAVVGAGPAGLIAAETLAAGGAAVTVYDRMPSVGRKLLMAGRGGLNLTHSEPFERLIARYGTAAEVLRPTLARFSPTDLIAWTHALGQPTFIGSSGRVFPCSLKASPLLRAWLARLATQGVELRTGRRWTGWSAPRVLRFEHADGGTSTAAVDVTLLALGGASWPRLGSDGTWAATLAQMGVDVAALRAANCGFDVAWSAHLRERFAGAVLKTVAASFAGRRVRGAVTITAYGVEGGPVYALGAALRDALASGGEVRLEIDLKPDLDATAIARRLGLRARKSLGARLRQSLGLDGAAVALLHERSDLSGLDPTALAGRIKAVPLPLEAPRPLARAISTAGGVRFADTNADFGLRTLPRVRRPKSAFVSAKCSTGRPRPAAISCRRASPPASPPRAGRWRSPTARKRPTKRRRSHNPRFSRTGEVDGWCACARLDSSRTARGHRTRRGAVRLSDRMAAANQRPAGFDYLRLILASSVIVNHAFIITGSPADATVMWNGPDRAVIGLILPAFFVLSGFLVTGSLERNRTLVSFLLLRVTRIVPALAMDVCVAALIIGPLFTTLPIRDYVSSPVFHSYFLNVLAHIHSHLPGLSAHTPYYDNVNRQLWTIPWELQCYATLACLAVIGIVCRRGLFYAVVALLQVAVLAYVFLHHAPPNAYPTGVTLVGSFIAGVTAYKLRERIRVHVGGFIVALALSMALPFVRHGYELLFAPLTYVVVYLGTLNPRRTWVVTSGDYSYGLYLYGLPLQQALTSLGGWAQNPWVDLAIAYPLAFALAMFSWHLVEKRANRARPYILKFESWLLGLPPIRWHSRYVLKAALP